MTVPTQGPGATYPLIENNPYNFDGDNTYDGWEGTIPDRLDAKTFEDKAKLAMMLRDLADTDNDGNASRKEIYGYNESARISSNAIKSDSVFDIIDVNNDNKLQENELLLASIFAQQDDDKESLSASDAKSLKNFIKNVFGANSKASQRIITDDHIRQAEDKTGNKAWQQSSKPIPAAY